MQLSFIRRSQTTFRVSRHLIPLVLVTGFSCLLAVSSYALLFFPAQLKLHETKMAHKVVQRVYAQKQIAQETQKTLATLWNALPAHRDFTGLSVSISSLAKQHKLRIPGMGYNIQTFRHDLASKGVLSFEASGKYAAIRQFIFDLESKWPYVFIEQLSVEKSKKSQDVAFKIKVSTFLRDLEENQTKPL